MEKLIYIIRHGETDLNRQGIMQGRGVDADLNERGRCQAEAFYNRYKDVAFDEVITSTLKRTHQTVSKFTEQGIPWVQYSGLDEIAWGKYEGKESSEELRADFKIMLEHWSSGNLSFKFEGAESPLELKERQLEVLETLIKNDQSERILICMHGRAMRIFLCLLLDKPLSMMNDFLHTNTSLYILRYDGKHFHMIDFNNTDHLIECEKD